MLKVLQAQVWHSTFLEANSDPERFRTEMVFFSMGDGI